MTVAEPHSSRVAEEMWISFASLLRSHVAMRSIARPNGGLVVAFASDGVMEIAATNTGFRMFAPAASGVGRIEWSGDHQDFFFTEDGLIEFIQSGTEPLSTMELEFAVEYLLDRVCQ